MARIAIFIGRHLCTAPRPCKEADALAASGHVVTVMGLWSQPNLVERDEALLRDKSWTFRPYADCRPTQLAGRLRWSHLRLRHRLSREIFVRTGRVTADVFGYGTSRLTAAAERERADLTIFHSEGGLFAARRLRALSRKTGVDFEDWFSRDLPPAVQAGRPIAALAELERAALRDPYVVTTSHALADALAAAYLGPKPAVIYNTFPRRPQRISDSRPESAPVSLHWFSQTIGAERGLETLFAALPALTFDWRLLLRGDDPSRFATQLIAELPRTLQDRVRVEPTVANAELPARITEHDIGLALDVSHIPSRNLTITNKLFQYLEAGLALVASDTAGHREALASAVGAGELFPAGDVAGLAAALNRLGRDRARLRVAKQAALAAAAGVFAFERQAPLYGELVDIALRR